MALLDRILTAENRRFLSFGASSVTMTVVNMVGGVLALRWIPPELMGAWQAVILAQAYCDFCKLGVLNGMNRELPFRIGQNDGEGALASVATTYAWLKFGSLLGFVAYAGIAMANWDKGQEWRIACLAGSAQWVLNYYSSYVQATLRGGDDFARLSAIQYVSALVSASLFPLVIFLGFDGFCLRAVLQALIMAICLRSVMRFRPSTGICWHELRRLLLAGFPLFAASYLFQLAMNAERWALLASDNERLLGLFAPVSAVLSAVLVLPNAASMYIYPKLSRELGSHGERERLWDAAWLNTRITVGIAIVVAAASALLSSHMTHAFFPQYAESIPAMQVASVSGIFLAFRPISTALPALGAWKWHYAWIVLFVAIKYVLCLLFICESTDKLLAVALAGTISAAVSAGVMVWAVFRETKGQRA